MPAKPLVDSNCLMYLSSLSKLLNAISSTISNLHSHTPRHKSRKNKGSKGSFLSYFEPTF